MLVNIADIDCILFVLTSDDTMTVIGWLLKGVMAILFAAAVLLFCVTILLFYNAWLFLLVFDGSVSISAFSADTFQMVATCKDNRL